MEPEQGILSRRNYFILVGSRLGLNADEGGEADQQQQNEGHQGEGDYQGKPSAGCAGILLFGTCNRGMDRRPGVGSGSVREGLLRGKPHSRLQICGVKKGRCARVSRLGQ